MALKFQAPFDIKQAKTKEEAFSEALSPTIQSLPMLYLQHKNQREQLKRDALAAKRDTGYKNVQQKIELLKLGRGQAIVDPATNQQTILPGVTGYRIDFDGDGVPDLVREDGTVDTSADKPITGVSIPPPSERPDLVPPTPGVAGVKLVPSQPKGPVDKEAAKQAAKIAAEKPKATGSFKNTLREYDNMIKAAEAIRNDAALTSSTGIVAGRMKLTGGQRRVAANLETLKAKTLINVLTGIKELSKNGASGFGQLNITEGDAIRNSVSSLDRTQDTPDFVTSLDRFIEEMKGKRQNLQDTFTATYGEMPSSAADGNPKTVVQNGHTYTLNESTGQYE